MSNIFTYLSRGTGALAFNIGSGALGAVVKSQHLNLDDVGGVYAVLDGTITHYGAGLPFDADGRLVVSEGAVARVDQTMPFTASGAVSIETGVAGTRVSQGLFYGATNQLTVDAVSSRFIVQPTSDTINEPDIAIFGPVETTDLADTFQWEAETVAGNGIWSSDTATIFGGRDFGSDTDQFFISPTISSDSRGIRVIASGLEGDATSREVTLTVNAAAVFAEFRNTGNAEAATAYTVTETTDGSSFYDVDHEFGTGDGVFYVEFTALGSTTSSPWFGVTGGGSNSGYLGAAADGLGYNPPIGQVRRSGGSVAAINILPNSNTNVLSLIVDFDVAGGLCTWYVDGALAGSMNLTALLIASGGTASVGVGQGSSASSYNYEVNTGYKAFTHPELIPVGCQKGWGTGLEIQT